MANARLHLYPTPASDYLIIENLPMEGMLLQIIDFQGKTRWSGNIGNGGEISLAELPSGLYALRLPTALEVEAQVFIKK